MRRFRSACKPPHRQSHAQELHISKDAVHRIWRTAGVKPHRLERYLASNDPDFESKAAAIIGLYLNPPQQAPVFCVDEKYAIQALDRLEPYRCRPAELSDMALNTIVTAHSRCMPLWRRSQGKYTASQRHAIPTRSLNAANREPADDEFFIEEVSTRQSHRHRPMLPWPQERLRVGQSSAPHLS
jgi:hypothetical protein